MVKNKNILEQINFDLSNLDKNTLANSLISNANMFNHKISFILIYSKSIWTTAKWLSNSLVKSYTIPRIKTPFEY